ACFTAEGPPYRPVRCAVNAPPIKPSQTNLSVICMMEAVADSLSVEAIAWQPLYANEPTGNPWRHVGRNDPCPCGSGKKAKKCCLAN
ncbi:MAG: SEC-C domain-containing protein, partial [Hyphomicrobiales bacterium]|nr:SEC-C domain-containing protein [Hyphomicrobiales bacterium]